jgi:NDP-sugar pyrophosphorylase family protein
MHLPPWELTAKAVTIVQTLLVDLDPREYRIQEGIAVHHTATVEAGATLKGPLLLGPHCFVAAGAYLRGGNWLAAGCSLGPGTELKSSFLFEGSKLAHFNFVGDSILGAGINMEAGSIICNFRNERPEKEVRVRLDGKLHGTGTEKFGALLGDGARVGANAVLAPGTLLPPKSVVGRTVLCDQELDAP